jgi:hypothetical protein
MREELIVSGVKLVQILRESCMDGFFPACGCIVLVERTERHGLLVVKKELDRREGESGCCGLGVDRGDMGGRGLLEVGKDLGDLYKPGL